ncbi:MAG: TIGR04013 family B12-binding domain/radical SAM domain-containing protein [Gammaproteobacteria bacterium]|jgi:B12-binding domain/radical SAM domain protein
MPHSNLSFILNYQQTGKYALNVITGSIMTQRLLRDIPIHFARNTDALINHIEHAKAQSRTVVVAWSFYSPQFEEMKQQLATVKHHIDAPSVIHLAGGVHATAEPLQTLNAGFDLVAVGEGEQIVTDLLTTLYEGSDPRQVRGIAYLDNGVLVKNGKGQTIDLNDYPPCASRFRKFGPVEITRGCVYACKFCQTPYVNKARFRHRSIENIAHYVRIMAANGLRDYRFLTPTSFSYGSQDENVNIDAIETMLATVREIIGKQRRIFYGTFPSEIRPEHVTKHNMAILKKYVDNDNVIIGGQSGSQAILDSSRRGHDVASIINAVKICVKAGFQPNVDFLFGLPGETRRDAQLTIDLANQLTELGARIHNHTFMPLPGTPFRNEKGGTINQQTRHQLVALTAKGKAYGKWKGQLIIARELEKLRSK